MKSTPMIPPRSQFLRRLLGACVIFSALFGATAFGQATGSITGVVTDKATSGFLVGAEIRIAGTSLITATARDGSFTLLNVPAGAQTLEVSYVGRKTKAVPVSVTAGAAAKTAVDLGEGDVLVLEAVTVERSEERRVGKECRSRGERYQ